MFEVPQKPWGDAELEMMFANLEILPPKVRAELLIGTRNEQDNTHTEAKDKA